MQSWTERNFDQMCWHDNHVHGLALRAGEHGLGELALDIDYITEWICEAGEFRFRIAPATVTFHEVSDLRLAIDYAAASAAMGPFSLDGISREEFSLAAGHVSYRWKLALNWPGGEITFVSPRFTQILRRE